jgi:starch synthase
MKVLFAASEVSPFAKTGGLGDVVGALPRALQQRRGVSVRVICPLYSAVTEQAAYRDKLKFVKYIYVPLAWRNLYCGLFEYKQDGITYYFLDNEYYFKRSDLYGHFDDGERFAFFSRAVASILPELDWKPDVIHCHDWQTALIPIYMRTFYRGQAFYDSIRTVFTIHNIEYQGRYARSALEDVFGLSASLFNGGTLEYNGGVNLMKGAVELSDAVTTVSPNYAKELSYAFFAHGMEGVLAHHSHKLSGILNGIDQDVFNPQTDPELFASYGPDDLKGKKKNKAELQKLLHLQPNPDAPIVGMVSRLVSHKGLDLVAASLDAMMDMENVQFVILGRGDWHFEHVFGNAQHNYEGRLSANIMFNNSLAMKIYAGSDIFLMPSQTEPCGLSQMIAMRYGSVPLVREIGGLKDTVFPYNREDGSGNGFTFENYNAHDMQHVLREAIELYKDRAVWKTLMRRGMTTDFSWADSQKKYLALYTRLVKNG